MIATGAAGNPLIDSENTLDMRRCATASSAVARELAQRIIRDGGRRDQVRDGDGRRRPHAAECLQVAYTVAQSPLIKTAMFASDPNWGRFCMAIGRAGIAGLDADESRCISTMSALRSGGMIAPEYTEEAGARVMSAS